jgi:hypothetical protein
VSMCSMALVPSTVCHTTLMGFSVQHKSGARQLRKMLQQHTVGGRNVRMLQPRKRDRFVCKVGVVGKGQRLMQQHLHDATVNTVLAHHFVHFTV